MKTLKIFLSVILVLVLNLTGCVMIDSNINGPDFDAGSDAITGSGKIVVINLDYRNFNAIDLSGGFKCEIASGNDYKVRIEIDDNLEDYLITSKSGSEISIGMQPGNNYKSNSMKITIVTPDLAGVVMNGGCVMNISDFSLAHTLNMELNGGSYVTGEFSAESVKVNMTGGSIITFDGVSDNLQINGSGGCILNLLEFAVENCIVNLSGGSISSLQVSKILEAELSGGSILRYKGNPVVKKMNLSGGSVIQKLD